MIDFKVFYVAGEYESRKAKMIELLSGAGAQFATFPTESADHVAHFGNTEPHAFFRDEKIGNYEALLSFLFGTGKGKFKEEYVKVKLLNERATVPTAGSTLAVGLDLSACLPELTDTNYIEYGAAMRAMGLQIHWHLPSPDGTSTRQHAYFALARGAKAIIPIGIAVEIPRNHYLRIAPRSGLAVKKGIATMAGVVDADFRGEIHVVMINHGDEPFEIKHGDRIAQGILEKAAHPAVFVVPKLSETTRGEAGWGSTGIGSLETPQPDAEPMNCYEAKALAAESAD